MCRDLAPSATKKPSEEARSRGLVIERHRHELCLSAGMAADVLEIPTPPTKLGSHSLMPEHHCGHLVLPRPGRSLRLIVLAAGQDEVRVKEVAAPNGPEFVVDEFVSTVVEPTVEQEVGVLLSFAADCQVAWF